MGYPTQGTVEQVAVQAMTNKTLAQQMNMICAQPRGFDKAFRDAVMTEAARRLRWPDAYESHR